MAHDLFGCMVSCTCTAGAGGIKCTLYYSSLSLSYIIHTYMYVCVRSLLAEKDPSSNVGQLGRPSSIERQAKLGLLRRTDIT